MMTTRKLTEAFVIFDGDCLDADSRPYIHTCIHTYIHIQTYTCSDFLVSPEKKWTDPSRPDLQPIELAHVLGDVGGVQALSFRVRGVQGNSPGHKDSSIMEVRRRRSSKASINSGNGSCHHQHQHEEGV